MQIDLSGKTAVVSGSTAGIGYAIACGLARAGASVVLSGRTPAALNTAVARLAAELARTQPAGAPVPDVRGVAADLGTADGCAALVRAEPQADILVNNLGVYAPQDFFDTPDDDWARLFEVNVMSGVRLARHYAPGMAQRGWGRIVFVSSE